MKKFQFILSILIGTVLLNGCAMDNKILQKEKIEIKSDTKEIFREERILPYDDIVNMGQYASAWIAPYKDNEDNLFNERRMNFWITKPTFIIGEKLPTNKQEVVQNKTSIIFNQENIKKGSNQNIELDNNVIEYLKKSK